MISSYDLPLPPQFLWEVLEMRKDMEYRSSRLKAVREGRGVYCSARTLVAAGGMACYRGSEWTDVVFAEVIGPFSLLM